VRVSGPATRSLAARLFRAAHPLKPKVATYGTVVDENGATLDRGIAILSVAPHSYTGEDTLELQIHGSPIVAREVVRALLSCGARYAGAGEFSRRALLNGKMNLQEASAVADLLAAESRSAARAAAANLGGGLAREVQALRSQLSTILEELAASIDFPDEVRDPDRAQLETALESIVAELQRLRREGEAGRLIREGVGVAIVGPPNAGTSSLLNALLGEDRAIVSEIPGTTRDTIEETIAVDGVPVRFIDTAGIRAHADRLETAGIERTRRALTEARAAIVVIDGSQPLGDEAREVLALTEARPRVVFCNKSDVGDAGARELGERAGVTGSVFDRQTLAELRGALARAVWGGELPDLERPHLAALFELEAVGQALEALDRARETLRRGDPADLIAGELGRAYAALGHLTAEAAGEELLTKIFARFCIGK
jgi:tRNA modification GTPase